MNPNNKTQLNPPSKSIPPSTTFFHLSLPLSPPSPTLLPSPQLPLSLHFPWEKPPAKRHRSTCCDMAIADQRSPTDNTPSNNNSKVWGFLKLPFLGGSNTNTTPSSSTTNTPTSTMMMMQQQQHHHHNHQPNSLIEGSNPPLASNSVSSVARSLLPTRRRLKLDPSSKLYFPCKFSILCDLFGFLAGFF